MDAVEKYTYCISWSEDDDEYVGTVAEMPSLSWLAKNPDDALSGIKRLVAGTVIDASN